MIILARREKIRTNDVTSLGGKMGRKGCSESSGAHDKESRKACLCPYCEGPIEMKYPICQACKVTLIPCPKCGKLIGKGVEVCIHCGSDIK